VSTSGLRAGFSVGRSATFAVEVEITVASGETVALLGPNGAGKTTAVAAIAGLMAIDTGMISLDGTVLDDPVAGIFVPAEDRGVGVVFQDYLLFPHMSAQDNVAFGLRSRGETGEAASARSRAWMEKLGLIDALASRPSELSGGQAQRVALARALVTEPALLLLDEPLAALDVTTRSELRRVLGEHLKEFQGPRLLITDDPAEAFLLADRILVIEEGRITQTGTSDEIRLRPQTRYAADLVGTNFAVGHARQGLVDVGGHAVHVADEVPDGRVLVTIHPTAVAIHREHPGGSPRNTWSTTVERVERLGNRARVLTGPPLPLTAELTEGARVELGIEAGAPIWVAIKATEIGVEPEGISEAG
jgi:molybdate transport system ATP-binding protein